MLKRDVGLVEHAKMKMRKILKVKKMEDNTTQTQFLHLKYFLIP